MCSKMCFKKSKGLMFLLVTLTVLSLLAACAPPTPQVVEKEVVVEKPVVQTVVVEKEKVVEKPVVETVVVEKPVVQTVVVEKEVIKEVPIVTIHYLTVQQENEGWPKIIGELTAEYQKDHPNVKWKYENVPQVDLVQKIQLLAAANALPLLFNFESGAPLKDLIKAGQVLDIEKTFKELGIYEELNPAAVGLLKGLAGGLYALPLEMNIEGFWYNKKIFADNGLKEPTTWDEMLQIAETLQKKGIQPFAASGEQRWPITRLINGYVMRKYGYDVMARVAKGELKVTDAGFVEAARIVQDMGLKGYFGKGVTTIDYNTAVDLFLQGKAAMFYMGSWELRDYNNPERNKIGAENIGFFNIPLVKDGVGTLDDWSMNCGLTTSISKAKYDENPEAIGDWLKYVFSNYGDRAMSELGMITGFRVKKMPETVPPLTAMTQEKLASAVNGALWFEAYMSAKAGTVAMDNVQKLVTDSAYTPEQYMADLQRALEE